MIWIIFQIIIYIPNVDGLWVETVPLQLKHEKIETIDLKFSYDISHNVEYLIL